MTVLSIKPPFEVFTDVDGDPLHDGYVYVGVKNLNPETNPITVYFDAALTITAAQPLRTLDGYISRNGSPANLYTREADYSITIKNKNGTLVYSSLANQSNVETDSVSDIVSLLAVPTPSYSASVNVASYHSGWQGTATGPVGGGTFVWDANKAKSNHNGGTIISPTVPWDGTQANLAAFLAGTGETQPGGSGCWIRTKADVVNITEYGAKGDGIVDDTASIKKAINATVGRLYFPSGIYLCDPIAFGTVGQPTVSTLTIVGDGSGYNGAVTASSVNVTTIRCRIAGTVFWDVVGAHRFQMENISLDADGLCSTTYKVNNSCTVHHYDGCAFINASNGGDNVILGDAVNLQVDFIRFTRCFFTNTKGSTHSRNVFITGTNTIANTFDQCRFINADYHVWFAAGTQANVINYCDFFAYTNNAIFSSGTNTYTIRGNYTESATGTAFFSEASVVYSTSSQGLCLIESNYINTANGHVTVSPNHQVTIRGNRIGGTLTLSAPTTANQYYPVDVYSNQYASITDASSMGRIWNNMDSGAGQDSDKGELIAVSVGQGASSADTYRKYKRPIQINTGSVYSSSSGNFQVANNCNAGSDDAALVAGYGQTINFGGASGNLSLLASTTSAAGTGSIHTLIGGIVDGSNSAFRPNGDNTVSLGRSSFRWSVVYAATGTINTSDEREKQDIADLDDAERRVANKLKGLIKKFRFKDAVQNKGDNARIHVGAIAQEVAKAFEDEGLDPNRYGILCYDEWPDEFEDVIAEVTEIDEYGNEHREMKNTGERRLVREAGNRYGIRYEEMLSFIIAAM